MPIPKSISSSVHRLYPLSFAYCAARPDGHAALKKTVTSFISVLYCNYNCNSRLCQLFLKINYHRTNKRTKDKIPPKQIRLGYAVLHARLFTFFSLTAKTGFSITIDTKKGAVATAPELAEKSRRCAAGHFSSLRRFASRLCRTAAMLMRRRPDGKRQTAHIRALLNMLQTLFFPHPAIYLYCPYSTGRTTPPKR